MLIRAKAYQGETNKNRETCISKEVGPLCFLCNSQPNGFFFCLVFYGHMPKDKDLTSQWTASSLRPSPQRHSLTWHSCCLGTFYFQYSRKPFKGKQSSWKITTPLLLTIRIETGTGYWDRFFYFSLGCSLLSMIIANTYKYKLKNAI